jgi:hypothetical protein
LHREERASSAFNQPLLDFPFLEEGLKLVQGESFADSAQIE